MERIKIEREDGIVQQRPHIVLLTHLHKVWSPDEAFVSTEDLLDRLVRDNPQMWGIESSFGKRLTAQRMGRMLVSAYNIHSDRLDVDGTKVRGYRRSTLAPAFGRFGLDPSRKPAGPVQPAEPVPKEDATLCSVGVAAQESATRATDQCSVCCQPFLLPLPGKTVCEIRDDAHTAARGLVGAR